MAFSGVGPFCESGRLSGRVIASRGSCGGSNAAMCCGARGDSLALRHALGPCGGCRGGGDGGGMGYGIGSLRALDHGAILGILLGGAKTKADGNGGVDVIHHGVVKMSHLLLKAALIQGSDLLQKDHRILGEPHLFGVNIDMRGESCLAHARGDGGGNDRGTVFVADVVLNDEDGSQSSLLGAHHGAQIGVINISSSDTHFSSILSFLGAVGCYYFYRAQGFFKHPC